MESVQVQGLTTSKLSSNKARQHDCESELRESRISNFVNSASQSVQDDETHKCRDSQVATFPKLQRRDCPCSAYQVIKIYEFFTLMQIFRRSACQVTFFFSTRGDERFRFISPSRSLSLISVMLIQLSESLDNDAINSCALLLVRLRVQDGCNAHPSDHIMQHCL